jgi:uncharacterized membrane protein YesL
MSQPVNQDLELFKLNLLAEEYRNDFFTTVGVWFTTLIAVLVVELQTSQQYPPWTNLVAFVTLAIPTGLAVWAMIRFGAAKTYKRKLARLNTLIKKVQAGNSIPDLDELLRTKKV